MSRREFIILIVTTFIVIMVWIISDILHTKAGVEINPKLEQAREPINPNFDLSIIQQIHPLRATQPTPIPFTPPLTSPNDSSPSSSLENP